MTQPTIEQMISFLTKEMSYCGTQEETTFDMYESIRAALAERQSKMPLEPYAKVQVRDGIGHLGSIRQRYSVVLRDGTELHTAPSFDRQANEHLCNELNKAALSAQMEGK